MPGREHLWKQSRVTTIVARCAVIAAVVALGVFTVGAAGAIALGAGASVAVFSSTPRAARLRHRPR